MMVWVVECSGRGANSCIGPFKEIRCSDVAYLVSTIEHMARN